MSTVLIIGATSAVAKSAAERLKTTHKIATGGRGSGDLKVDLTGSVTIPKDIDVVVNFAAAFGGETDLETVETVETNVLGVLKLAMASKQADVKHFVQISSMSAVLSTESPYYSAYAISKRQGDEFLTWYCNKHDLALTILRPSQLYGNDASFANHQPFFYQIVNNAARGEDVTIFGEHDALRNYIHVDDFSEIVTRVIDQRILGTYPCLYPENKTYSAIAKTAQRIYAKGGEVVFLKDKPSTPDNVFTPDTAIYDQTGYSPQISLEQGIRKIMAQGQGGAS